MDNINRVMENSALYKFLGMEEVADLRRMVKETIVDTIRTDLKSSHYYIVTPNDINELLGKVVDEAVEEIKDEYKAQIAEMVKKKMEGIVL